MSDLDIGADIIDSLDIIARIDYLEGTDDSEELEELEMLMEFQNEAEGYAPNWRYGETLILDSYFEEYAQDLADDIGAIDRNASWPLTCIDWEQAARELQMDYMSVELDGYTYWIR